MVYMSDLNSDAERLGSSNLPAPTFKTENERRMEANEIIFTYKVKCRSCGKVADMYFGSSKLTKHSDFVVWALEHSTFPIQSQCKCDSGSMMFHDLISYSPIV